MTPQVTDGTYTAFLLDFSQDSQKELFFEKFRQCLENHEEEDDKNTNTNSKYELEKLNNEGLDACSSYFADTSKVFLLFDDQNQFAGFTQLAHGARSALFEYTYIMRTHRGKGLSQLAYHARAQYFCQETPHKKVTSLIFQSNVPSIKAAERFGMELRTIMPFAKVVNCEYTLKLDDIRPRYNFRWDLT